MIFKSMVSKYSFLQPKTVLYHVYLQVPQVDQRKTFHFRNLTSFFCTMECAVSMVHLFCLSINVCIKSNLGQELVVDKQLYKVLWVLGVNFYVQIRRFIDGSAIGKKNFFVKIFSMWVTTLALISGAKSIICNSIITPLFLIKSTALNYQKNYRNRCNYSRYLAKHRTRKHRNL